MFEETPSEREEKFKAAYEALFPKFDIANQLIAARKAAGLSQTEVAKLLKTKQPAIARLECGGYAKTSIEKLQAYAEVLGYALHLQLIHKDVENSSEK